MRYATHQEMKTLQFGCTGREATINGTQLEFLADPEGEFGGWAAKHIDADGLFVDWDYVSEAEARELGLI